MKTFYAHLIRNGVTFTAMLSEDNNARRCYEHVVRHGDLDGKPSGVIHDAEFDSACLGMASRDGYLRTMLSSVVNAYDRATFRNVAFPVN